MSTGANRVKGNHSLFSFLFGNYSFSVNLYRNESYLHYQMHKDKMNEWLLQSQRREARDHNVRVMWKRRKNCSRNGRLIRKQ